MKVYISLPITGHPLEECRQRADKFKQKLTQLGHESITPFDVCQEENKPYSHYMGKDIESLLECDAIFLACNWYESKGCHLEKQAANIYGKIVLDEEYLN